MLNNETPNRGSSFEDVSWILGSRERGKEGRTDFFIMLA